LGDVPAPDRMALGRDWLITLAIVRLAIGILLRFVRPRDVEPPPPRAGRARALTTACAPAAPV